MRRSEEIEELLDTFCTPECFYDILEDTELVLDEIVESRLSGFIIEQREFFKKRLEDKIHELIINS